MPDAHVDIDSLIGAWRGAFQAAQSALLAASRDHDMGGAALQTRSRRLSDERADLVGVLGSFAHDRYARPRLVRLLGSPVETRKLLGLPAAVEACVFNVDGILVASAALHAEVWREMLNRFVARRIEQTGVPLAAFSRRIDYPELMYGRSPRGRGARLSPEPGDQPARGQRR